jgi:hypothetical protein
VGAAREADSLGKRMRTLSSTLIEVMLVCVMTFFAFGLLLSATVSFG